jgi:hypothetical protein
VGSIYQTFCHCDKIPGKNNLKEEGFILAHGFRAFRPWSAGSITLGLRQDKMSWQRKHGAEAARLRVAGKQKDEQTGEGREQDMPLKTPPSDLLLPTRLTS